MITTTSAIGIQMGLNTHHHDQLITSQSFKTINAIAKRPQKPMPPLLDPEDAILFSFIKYKNLIKKIT